MAHGGRDQDIPGLSKRDQTPIKHHNLVVTHGPCNGEKRDHLVAAEHVERWAERQAAELGAVATATRWPREPERTLGVARSIYLRLPASARLWQLEDRFVPVEGARLRRALGAG
jgi:hypothetical protein